MSKENIHVFIGLDDGQVDAYRTCAYSIRTNSGPNVKIHPLNHRDLRRVGLFKRPWLVDENGNWSDAVDARPFSTTFSHTRFLTPSYYDYLGLNLIEDNRWAVFLDSDMICLEDFNKLVSDAKATGRPLSVVKHNYMNGDSASGAVDERKRVKMDGRDQAQYNCKLWSSLMVFDMWQFDYTDEDLDVNKDDGRGLHTFDWYRQGLDGIGSLPEAWNFIPDHSEKNTLTPKMIHYTEGLPLHYGYERCRYGEVFNQYYQGMLTEKARRINDGLD